MSVGCVVGDVRKLGGDSGGKDLRGEGWRKRNEYAVVAKGSRSGGAGACGAGACVRVCRFDATYLFAE